MKELGVIGSDNCSTAWSANSKGQIVGASRDCGIAVHAFLWESGHMIDLTSLIRPGIELTYALTINDAGEIAAIGRLPGGGDTGLQHAFPLIPTEENSSAESDTAAPNKSATEKRSIRDFRFPVGRAPRTKPDFALSQA